MADGSVPVPQTMTADGKAVGARTPPHWLSLCCMPACAISGYETGDPTEGCCTGKALVALVLNFLSLGICGGLYALMGWKPDPEALRGDGTSRTVKDKCMAGFFVGGPQTIGFWESGDMCCTPDGNCTWCSGDAIIGSALRFLPAIVGLPPLDCCYVMCFWQPNNMNFKRSTLNHGGGKAIVGAPVQVAGPFVSLQQAVADAQTKPQVVGNAVVVGTVVDHN